MCGKRTRDDLLSEHEVADLVLRYERLELAVREVFHVRGEYERLDREQDEKSRDEIPDGELLSLGFHRSVHRPRSTRNVVAFGIRALLVRVVVSALRFVAGCPAPAGAHRRSRQ